MFMSYHQNAGCHYHIKKPNKSLKNVKIQILREKQQQIKITADYIQGMLITILFRILLSLCLLIKNLKY
jgi:hypothetical protein